MYDNIRINDIEKINPPLTDKEMAEIYKVAEEISKEITPLLDQVQKPFPEKTVKVGNRTIKVTVVLGREGNKMGKNQNVEVQVTIL